MSNPNNCSSCGHKQNPDGGHCYMFRDEPLDVCMQHMARRAPSPLIVAIRIISAQVREQNAEVKP